jgi:hypothetical protein
MLSMIRTEGRHAVILAASAAAWWCFAACATDHRGEAITGLTPPQTSSDRGRRLTDQEAEEFVMSHDLKFASLVNEAIHNKKLTPSMDVAVASTSTSGTTDLSSQVTPAGFFAGSTTTAIEAVSSLGTPMATWASETKVLSGFAYRVHLSTKGTYSQSTLGAYRSKQFSDVCGDALTDLFKQQCLLGSIYADIECYYTNGVIVASSQHSVTWRFSTEVGNPSGNSSHCSDSPGWTGDTGGTCDSYQIIDTDTAPTDSSDECGGGGDGTSPADPTPPPPPDSGNDTGSDIGGDDLCTTLLLDAGCYDVYVDEVYDSTICC